MERISGTIIEIDRASDGRGSWNPAYLIDVNGLDEKAIDYGQRWFGLEVGEPATFIGRRAVSGELSIHAYER